MINSQTGSRKFENFSIEHGLSQTTVHSLIQDKQGFIWIGTEDGLNRYDGYQFVVYRNDREDSTTLASNYVRVVFQDSNDLIWVGTNNGLSLLSLVIDNASGKNKEGFISFISDPDDLSTLSNNEIRCIFQDKSGILWVGTANGLNSLIINSVTEQNKNLRDRVKITRFGDREDSKESLSKILVSSITEDHQGNLYFGTMGTGLKQLNKQPGVINTYKNDPSDLSSIGSNYIVRLFTSRDGRVWIGTYNGGLNLFDNKTGRFKQFLHNERIPFTISDNRVYGMVDDEDGNLWVSTFGGGLNYLDLDSEKFLHYKNNKDDEYSISSDFVRSVFIDKSENLWVATNYGVSKTDLKLPKFITYRNIPSVQHSLSDNYVLSVIEDNSGTLWVGTNKGLDKYISETNSFINFKIPHNNPKSGEGFVYSVLEDELGILWLGTFGGGMIKVNKDGKILKYFQHNPNNINSISDNRITTLFLDDNKEIIIGTVAGICRFDKKSETFRKCIASPIDSISLFRKRISAIFKDSNNIYWIGTTSGLFKVNPADSSSISYLHEPDDPGSIVSNNILSLQEDKAGNILIGTNLGLNILNKSKDELMLITTRDGLPNNYISNIIIDAEANYWISTNKGISKYSPHLEGEKKFRNFDIQDGLQGLEFIPCAKFKNSKEDIYFGGTSGLNKFNPVALKDNPHIPNVVIASFNKFGREEYSFLYLSQMKEIALGYDESYFTFLFSSMDFTKPEKNNYAYMLEGFDDDWIYTGSSRFANYTSIDPGKYTFCVKASNNDGIWNEKGASIKLIIHPPFYRTWTAYIFYVIFIVGILFLIRRYELRKRKEKNESLIKEERERSKLLEVQLRAEKAELQAKAIETEQEIEKQKIRYRIASDLHDEIGSNLSSIALLSSIMSKRINPDDEISSQLSDITAAAKNSTEAIREIVWFLNPTSDLLSWLLSKMKETANTMLKNISYSFHTEEIEADRKINPEIKRNIYLIFKESLNNIIKHSGARNVTIFVINDNGRLTLHITDDGAGFDQATVIKGNGLLNLSNRAEQIGAELQIISSKGKGTTIIISTDIA